MSKRERNAQRMADSRRTDPRLAWDVRLRAIFGITADQFDAMAEAQGNRCALCKTDTPGGKGRWHVDHNHRCCPGNRSCGRCVRALLCTCCNAGLAQFRDSPALLAVALTYLETWNEQLPERLSEPGS